MKMKMKVRTIVSGYIILLPALIVMLMFNFYPVIWSFLVSFKETKAIDIKNSALYEIPGVFVGVENYQKVLDNDLFFKSIVNTGYFAIIFIPFTLLFSLLLAIYVNQKFKGVNFFRTIIFVPYIISVISSSLIFMTLFNTEAGFVNATLEFFGIQGISWLGDERLAMPVIALMSIWRRVGYFMLLYLAGLQNIPKSLYEAAQIDGANWLDKFRNITVPLLSKITIVIMVLLLRDALTIFQEVFVMTGGGPGNSTVTVPFLIYQEAFSYLRFGTAAAMSYILFVIAVIVILIQNKIIMRKGRVE
jgi:multiple sugar transport system permease protein